LQQCTTEIPSVVRICENFPFPRHRDE
jgi:hypothetical protein